MLDRMARVAFVFLMMNCAAVMGLFTALSKRNVWRG
jgi:hypothetical protein